MKLCFIIASKYIRGYESYINYYISNINNFYGEDAHVIVVDNNSVFKEDVFLDLKKYKNVTILDNNIESKFEIGAYTVAINYLIENNLNNNYEYYIFTQDNFVIKNKYDFNILSNQNVNACTIYSYEQDGLTSIIQEVLTKLDLFNNLDKITFCWALGFILNKSKILQLSNYFNKIVVVNRAESEAGERYLARILYELNEHRNYDIDGRQDCRRYDCWSIDLKTAITDHYFCKRVQQKTEKTKDLWM